MKLDTAAQLFRALGDRTRIRILHLLLTRELTGTQIADALRVPRGRVARHLRYLYRSWLVTTRRKSNHTYYALRPSEYPLHEAVRQRVLPLLKEPLHQNLWAATGSGSPSSPACNDFGRFFGEP